MISFFSCVCFYSQKKLLLKNKSMKKEDRQNHKIQILKKLNLDIQNFKKWKIIKDNIIKY